MDLTDYRASSLEQQRTADLLRHVPKTGQCALDIGARDGHFSRLLVERFEKVVALDLAEPKISHPRIQCVTGNAAEMSFPENAFDLVFCAEVLEHISEPTLHRVCQEIQRVARHQINIGVPYKQDIRIGRTTCRSCGAPNPPYGHVNSFDEQTILKLFQHCEIESISFVGTNTTWTNSLSTFLMDFAGNPYGTYDQEEPCIQCGQRLLRPPVRSKAQLLATKLAFWSRSATEHFARPRGNWMHLVLRKFSDV